MRQASRPAPTDGAPRVEGRPCRSRRAARPTGTPRASTACAVIGAACLWAWGYVANLSPALFPSPDVAASIGIEFAYYTSQLTVLSLGILLAAGMRRWQPSLSPAAVVGAAALLALASCALAALLRAGSPPFAAIACCGVLYGLGGMVLTVAWGARLSLGVQDMRRPVLLSFLLGYALYLASLYLPSRYGHLFACALPFASGLLWLADSWRRHQLTAEVWPTKTPDGALPGEASAGSPDVSILPWHAMALFAATALVGNLISALIMGSTYDGAAIMFPGGFLVCACIACAALVLVPAGKRRVSVERLYRYCLPFAVLGMLLIMAFPDGDHALAGALVSGSSIFLQALVILKVTEATQMEGLSPLLSFGVGQGVISGVVFAGNVLGRVLSGIPTASVSAGAGDGIDSGLLPVACGAGVFILFFLLAMVTDALSNHMATLKSGLAQMGSPDSPKTGAAGKGTGKSGQGSASDTRDPGMAGLGDPNALGALADFAACHDLTKREAEVCAYLLRGRSLPLIAEHLCVTAGTVKTHAAHIYAALDCGSKQELIELYDQERGNGTKRAV